VLSVVFPVLEPVNGYEKTTLFRCSVVVPFLISRAVLAAFRLCNPPEKLRETLALGAVVDQDGGGVVLASLRGAANLSLSDLVCCMLLSLRLLSVGRC